MRGTLNAIGLALPPKRITERFVWRGLTLADLEGEERVARIHLAEALSYRGETLRRAQAAA